MIAVLLAFLAALFSGITNFLHRVISVKVDPITYAVIWGILVGLFYLPISRPSFSPVMLIGFALWLVIRVLGFYAYRYTEVSLKDPLSRVQLILVLIFSIILLQEAFTISKLAGTLLIMIGAIILTYKSGKFQFDLGVKLTLLVAAITSVAIVVDKFVLNTGVDPFWYAFCMFFFPSLVLLPFRFKEIALERKISKSDLAKVTASAILAFTSWAFYYYALSLGEASIVFPIRSTYVLVSSILGLVLLKEKDIARKLAGGVLVVLGGILLSLSF